MLTILLTTYLAVLLAEIVGDKLMYTTGILAARYRPVPIMVGMTAAFTAKMAAAVAVGTAIAHLPRPLVASVTALSFIALATTLWRKPMKSELPKDGGADGATKGAVVAFAAIFFSEWGDVGQITAATMAGRLGSPVIVGIGAVAAMVTKGVLAAYLGAGVRRWIGTRVTPALVRVGSVSLVLVLGAMAVAETVMGGQ